MAMTCHKLTLAYKSADLFLYTDMSSKKLKRLPQRLIWVNTGLLIKGIIMEISNEIGAHNPNAIEKKNSIQQTKPQTKVSTIETTPTTASKSNNTILSTEGKITQQIDTTSEQIDDILLRHITPEQKDTLDGIYQKLDRIFEKDQLTDKEENAAEALFEQVHNILETSVNKLTKTERKTVDKLANKMDGLISQLEKNDMSQSPNNNSVSAKTSSSSSDDLANIFTTEKQANKKALTVAELNALSVLELNKLPANQLKKLNAQQLNKLNASQLNSLALAQLKQLSANNLEKLNQSQTNKLSN